jgi:hypothetical protein
MTIQIKRIIINHIKTLDWLNDDILESVISYLDELSIDIDRKELTEYLITLGF